MDKTITIPQHFLARLMAAIETPGDLSEQDVRELLEDAHEYGQFDEEDAS